MKGFDILKKNIYTLILGGVSGIIAAISTGRIDNWILSLFIAIFTGLIVGLTGNFIFKYFN
ncbi:MAG: hypothetical protein ACOCP5_02620 [Halanaerobiaceae bacterium]